MEYFMGALKKCKDFTGRASRTEFWVFNLFCLMFYVASIIVDVRIGFLMFTVLLSIALLVPSISITTRRLHDSGRSGWWQLIVIIPIFGVLILLKMLVTDSGRKNVYGINPKFA